MTQTILLIEDDDVLVRMYKTLLENHGYVVDTAGDGEKGLEKALALHPDLILLDIRLPKMDGMATLKKLRHDTWGIKANIIVLTNLDPNDQILQGVVEDHPTYYLIKAKNKPEDVLRHIKEILEGEGEKEE